MALGTYNRTLANRRSGTMSYAVDSAFAGAVTAVMGAGAVYSINLRCDGAMDAAATGTYGHAPNVEVSAALTAKMEPAIYVLAQTRAEGALAAKVLPIAQAVVATSGALTASVSMRPAIYPQLGTLYGVLDAYFSGLQTKEIVMDFPTLSIPPGETLVIDSETFTATLNGENVIDQYSGEWLEITRLLKGIGVTSGTSGDIGVSILYRERYL